MKLSVRISGPFKSSKIATALFLFFAASRIFLIRFPCSSKSPWEKFNRATFIPASINCSIVSRDSDAGRSEEHTSELQSRGHLVCRLLLEKKKRKKKHIS